MDTRTHERSSQALHGLVGPRGRLVILLLGVSALVAGIAGGLLRAGVAIGPAGPTLGAAAAWHAALMIPGFFGTVIGLERAVALRLPAAFLVPLAAGAATALMLCGFPRHGAALGVVAATGFVAVNVELVRRQAASHTVVLLAGAVCWLVGSGLLLFGSDPATAIAWWFGLLVLTITAERLEMTRLMRRRAGSQGSLFGVMGLLVGGALLGLADPRLGALAYGLALMLLAAWLVLFDIARRTVRAHGLSRYMAVCLLGGYAWLALAGGAWAATGLGWSTRDAAFHALGLGFVISMVMGHAPVILPAVARIKLRFGLVFYLPLALLHASLLLRLFPGAHDAAMRRLGAELNAASIALFALTVVVSALVERRRA